MRLLDNRGAMGDEQEKRLTVPGVPGALTRNTEMTVEEFERQRRLELRQLKRAYPKNADTSGPTAEQAALHSELVAAGKPRGFTPGGERSILHCKGDYMEVPDTAPEYYRHKEDSIAPVCCLPKGTCKFTLKGHHKAVTSLSFIPANPHLLLSASADGRAKLWSVLTGQPLRTFVGHSTGIRQVLSDGHSHFLTLSTSPDTARQDDQQIKVWDVEHGKCTTALHLKKAPTVARYFHHSKRLLVGQQSGDIQLWDLHNRTLIRQFSCNTADSPVRTISLVGRHEFVSTADDRVVRLWNSFDSVPLQQIGKPDVCDSYAAAAVHPTDLNVVMASLSSAGLFHMFSYDPQQRHVKLRSRHLTIPPPAEPPKSRNLQVPPKAAFSPDGRFLAGTDRHGSVQFWDWTSGQPAKRLDAGLEQIADCAFSPADPNLFATGGVDRTVRLWT